MVYFGMVYHMIFVLMNSLILLNLVIAIMSEVINSIRSSKDGLYFSKIIEASPSWKNDKHYGFLIYAFIPLNVITLCLLPVCSKMGDKMLAKNEFGSPKNYLHSIFDFAAAVFHYMQCFADTFCLL